MNLPSVETADIKGKKVFLRADIDVPLTIRDNGVIQISDATRLEALQPTLYHLTQNNCQVILAGHIGRPGGKELSQLSSKPVAQWFTEGLKDPSLKEVMLGNIKGYVINDKLTVLENLRFFPGEEGNDENFAKELASLADVYVNESFATCERAHASIVGIPKFLPHYAGMRLIKEIEVFTTVMEIPRRPFVAVIGGAKLETKIPVINKMAEYADRVIVGGELLKEVTDRAPKVLYLDLANGRRDTTLESIDQTQVILSYASTIIWNGPVGYIEDHTFQIGTRRLAELIASNTKAFKIVGGGDTIGFIAKLGLSDKFEWVSIGGGSMLKFLAGEKLPGVEALLV